MEKIKNIIKGYRKPENFGIGEEVSFEYCNGEMFPCVIEEVRGNDVLVITIESHHFVWVEKSELWVETFDFFKNEK